MRELLTTPSYYGLLRNNIIIFDVLVDYVRRCAMWCGVIWYKKRFYQRWLWFDSIHPALCLCSLSVDRRWQVWLIHSRSVWCASDVATITVMLHFDPLHDPPHIHIDSPLLRHWHNYCWITMTTIWRRELKETKKKTIFVFLPRQKTRRTNRMPTPSRDREQTRSHSSVEWRALPWRSMPWQ